MTWQALVLVAAVGAVAAVDETDKKDFDALQGTWQMHH